MGSAQYRFDCCQKEIGVKYIEIGQTVLHLLKFKGAMHRRHKNWKSGGLGRVGCL